jgi:hypothetical protein
LHLILYDFCQQRIENHAEITTEDWKEIIKLSQDKDYFTKSRLFDELKYIAIAYLDK